MREFSGCGEHIQNIGWLAVGHFHPFYGAGTTYFYRLIESAV
jgi:hypothetical protein